MAQKIVLKKLGVLSIPAGCDSSSFERAHLKNKLWIVKITKPRYSNRIFYATQYNFKSNWLCKTSSTIFTLKPKRKFKTLMEYDLICQNCKSKKITHSNELSAAINHHVPMSTIIQVFKDKDIELEFTLDDKSRYHGMVFNEGK